KQLAGLMQGKEFGILFTKLRAGVEQKMKDGDAKARAGNKPFRDPGEFGFPPGTIGNDWELPPSGDAEKPGTPPPGSQTKPNSKPGKNNLPVQPGKQGDPPAGKSGKTSPGTKPGQPDNPGDPLPGDIGGPPPAGKSGKTGPGTQPEQPGTPSDPPPGKSGKTGTATQPEQPDNPSDQPQNDRTGQTGQPNAGNGQPNASGDPNQSNPNNGQPTPPGGGQNADGEDDAKSSDNDGGKPGPFKIKIPLSKWFVTLMDIVATYFGIKEISLKILTVAYLIAPEVFDYVGSYLAKLQHLMTPNSLEDFLNTLSDVYDYAMQFLQYAKMAYDLLTNPDLQRLVDKIDWKEFDLEKVLLEGEKVGIIKKHHLQKIKQYFPVDLIKGDILSNSDKLQGALKDYAGNQIKKQAKRIPGVGKYADLDKLWDCAASQDREKCMDVVKTSVKNGVFNNLPGEYRRYSDAFEDAWKGDYKAAAEKATAAELAHRTKISAAEAQALYRQAKAGDWKAFINTAAGTQIRKKIKNPVCQQQVRDVLDGKKTFTKEELWHISQCVLSETGNEDLADKIKLYGGAAYYVATQPEQLAAQLKNTLNKLKISEETLQKVLENNADGILRLMAKAIGLTSPEAQAAFVKGDLDRAIEAQTEWGVKNGLPRRDMNYYNNLGKQVKQGASNRVELLKVLLDAIRKGEIAVPDDLGKMLENSLNQSLH
ncbi:MAG: hypothetical protein AAB316_12620, partial [Bacteroidota bacterium]